MFGILLFLAVLRLFMWSVRAKQTPVLKAAALLGTFVLVIKFLESHDPLAAAVSGAVATACGVSLVWVDRRFQSLISIPIWLGLSMLLGLVLLGTL